MRKFAYIDDLVSGELIITEEELLVSPWWDHYVKEMIKADLIYLINKEDFIYEWMVVHWAVEIKE